MDLLQATALNKEHYMPPEAPEPAPVAEEAQGVWPQEVNEEEEVKQAKTGKRRESLAKRRDSLSKRRGSTSLGKGEEFLMDPAEEQRSFRDNILPGRLIHMVADSDVRQVLSCSLFVYV